MLPTPEPSRASSDCEDASTANVQPASHEATDDTLREFLQSVNEHESIKNDHTTDGQSANPNLTPDELTRDSNVDQPPSTEDDRQHRKRPAEENLPGQDRRGPVGQGSHQWASLSSFLSCLNTAGTTSRPRRTYKNLTSRHKAIHELIDEAPEHQKDITKAEIIRYFSSFNLNITPTLEDGDRRWTMKGLKTALRTYQAIGVGRMRWLEKRLIQPEFVKPLKASKNQGDDAASAMIPRGGGILADQMGLGSKF